MATSINDTMATSITGTARTSNQITMTTKKAHVTMTTSPPITSNSTTTISSTMVTEPTVTMTANATITAVIVPVVVVVLVVCLLVVCAIATIIILYQRAKHHRHQQEMMYNLPIALQSAQNEQYNHTHNGQSDIPTYDTLAKKEVPADYNKTPTKPYDDDGLYDHTHRQHNTTTQQLPPPIYSTLAEGGSPC